MERDLAEELPKLSCTDTAPLLQERDRSTDLGSLAPASCLVDRLGWEHLEELLQLEGEVPPEEEDHQEDLQSEERQQQPVSGSRSTR